MNIKRKPSIKWILFIASIFSLSSHGDTHRVHDIENKVNLLSEKITASEKLNTERFNQLSSSKLNVHDATINTIRETSKAAIESSNKSLETIKYVIYLGVTIITALVAFGVFFGYKDRKNLLEEHNRYVEESKEKIKELSKATENIMAKVPAHCVDLALLKNDLKEYESKYIELGVIKHSCINADERKIDKENLLRCSRTAIEVSKEISDFRSISWIYSELAVLHYHDGNFREALHLQEMAADPKYNLLGASDKFYNLACYASRLYDITRKDSHLTKAKNAYAAVYNIDPQKAHKLRGDSDMSAVASHLD